MTRSIDSLEVKFESYICVITYFALVSVLPSWSRECAIQAPPVGAGSHLAYCSLSSRESFGLLSLSVKRTVSQL